MLKLGPIGATSNISNVCWNAGGLKRRVNNFEFKQCILKHDIICITETWSDTLDEIKDIFDGFTCCAKIRNFMREVVFSY